MNDEDKQKKADEKRNYFRVNDLISIVITPLNISKDEEAAFLKTAKSSKAFSMMDTSGLTVMDGDHVSVDYYEDKKLYHMVEEIKSKLDYVINYLMIDKEGLNDAKKKMVNISASGIRFTMEGPVEMGDIMEVKFLLPTYPPVAVFAYGEVKRLTSLADNKFDAAMEYINMGDSVRDEIVQYTLSHQREIIRNQKKINTD